MTRKQWYDGLMAITLVAVVGVGIFGVTRTIVDYRETASHYDWGNPGIRGDFWGGHMAAAAGSVGALLLVVAVLMQRRELELQREELIQSRTVMKQQATALESQTRELKEANEFLAVTTIHKTMANRTACAIRGYLHKGFTDHLALVARDMWGDKCFDTVGCINVSAIRNNLTENDKELEEFNRGLREKLRVVKDFSALEAVESALLDWDLIALPFAMNIRSATAVKDVYATVLKRTARSVLPFVAIQKVLRGKTDPNYKYPYLKLLHEIGVGDAWLLLPS